MVPQETTPPVMLGELTPPPPPGANGIPVPPPPPGGLNTAKPSAPQAKPSISSKKPPLAEPVPKKASNIAQSGQITILSPLEFKKVAETNSKLKIGFSPHPDFAYFQVSEIEIDGKEIN